MNYPRRLRSLQERLEHPLLVSSLVNLRYLTGFRGSNGFLLVRPDSAVFVTDGRYGESAAALVEPLAGTELVVYRDRLAATLGGLMGSDPEIAVEQEDVTWGFVRRLADEVGDKLVPSAGVVEGLRAVKDDGEVAALRAAAAAGDAAFAALGDLVAAAPVEADLGWALVEEMRRNGGEPAGWDPIVAAGPNASVPHYRSGRDRIEGGLLLLDYGCVVDGYHSDMSRTVWLDGEPDAEMAEVYGIVAEAQAAGIAAAVPGATGHEVDAAARGVLAGYGRAEQMLHSTGHGVGLEIHEAPSMRTNGDEVLEPGHVVTIEPGVYLPGRGGVRIEDMVLVTDAGPVLLTSSPKEFA